MRLCGSQCCDYGQSERGFALVLVIWGIGIMSLLILTVMTTARQRAVVARNLVENGRAESLAEAGVAMLRLHLSARSRGVGEQLASLAAGRPSLCRLGGIAAAALVIIDEQGKIDLNTGTPGLLSMALRGVGIGEAEVAKLESNIAVFVRPIRQQTASATRLGTDRRIAYRAKHGPFDTVYELGQVPGVDRLLLRKVLPFITVYSQSSGIDPRVASSKLLSWLAASRSSSAREDDATTSSNSKWRQASLTTAIPTRYVSSSRHQTYAMRAEIKMPSGASRATEAIVTLGGGDATSQIVREWRSVASDFAELLKRAKVDELRSCRNVLGLS